MMYVLASNGHAALHCLRDHKIPQNEGTYVNNVNQLRGVRDPECLIHSSFWCRDDCNEILNQLRIASSYDRNSTHFPKYLQSEFVVTEQELLAAAANAEFDNDLPPEPNLIDEGPTMGQLNIKFGEAFDIPHKGIDFI
jgi:hypothetical protein